MIVHRVTVERQTFKLFAVATGASEIGRCQADRQIRDQLGWKTRRRKLYRAPARTALHNEPPSALFYVCDGFHVDRGHCVVGANCSCFVLCLKAVSENHPSTPALLFSCSGVHGPLKRHNFRRLGSELSSRSVRHAQSGIRQTETTSQIAGTHSKCRKFNGWAGSVNSLRTERMTKRDSKRKFHRPVSL